MHQTVDIAPVALYIVMVPSTYKYPLFLSFFSQKNSSLRRGDLPYRCQNIDQCPGNILVMEKNTEAEEEWKEKTNEDVLKSSVGSLCGLNHKLLINLFKWAAVSVNPNNKVKREDDQEEEEEISRLKISLAEKKTEVEKLKSLCLKQREEIKSLVDSSMISSQLEDLLDEFTSLKGRLQSLAHDVAQVKAETLLYSGRVNDHHTHFTSPPMTSSLYDQDDYYTSCHYANSNHRPD